MAVKDAMGIYFSKLESLYQETFGTLPTISWSSKLPQDLFIGTPDEDGEIQWKQTAAKPVTLSGFCPELSSLYGSYYYWELRGEYRNTEFDFPPIPTENGAKSVAEKAALDGEYYFPGQNIVLLASCSRSGNDDLFLFYRQNRGTMFLFDTDKEEIMELDFGLEELIGKMKAVI